LLNRQQGSNFAFLDDAKMDGYDQKHHFKSKGLEVPV